jgi:hypothetical protein
MVATILTHLAAFSAGFVVGVVALVVYLSKFIGPYR